MGRGRRAKPAEVKALLGNPGKRKLALDGQSKDAHARAAAAAHVIEPPAFLTLEGEREAFRVTMAALPPNLVRQSDAVALGRWAVWLNIWLTCKQALDGKAHWYTTESNFVKIHREHPLAKRMDKAEAHMVTLEDRLCLNIVARNNVMHRLFNMPANHPGAGLFANDPDEEKRQPSSGLPEPNGDPAELADIDPVGFLARASSSTPH